MANILLDTLPDEYNGYLIRTDFRIGIQMRLALEDNELTEREKVFIAIGLLFGNGAPPLEDALNGVLWYLRGGVEELTDESENVAQSVKNEATEYDDEPAENNFSFEVDAARIYTAFKRTYGVDLNTAQLHWFEFLAMLQDLTECAFTQVIEIRGKDLNKVPKGQRGEYARLKEKYALPQIYTEEQERKIKEFYDAFNG